MRKTTVIKRKVQYIALIEILDFFKLTYAQYVLFGKGCYC